jgi:PhoH-like ATPase
MNGYDKVPEGLNSKDADNKIISLALVLSKSSKQPLTLITKDINFRVKCDALGISSEDYYKDKIIEQVDECYKGYVDLQLKSKNLIDCFYEKEDILEDVEDILGRKLFANEFVSAKYESQSFVSCLIDGKLVNVNSEKFNKESITGVTPRNREQMYALNLLKREDIPLVSLTGIAGSGKTFLTLMAGLDGIAQGLYKRIVITRNIQPVGRDIGFLPGDADDKMMPWIAPIMDNFRQGVKDKDLLYFEAMRKRGEIEIAPLAFMRGRTFNDTFLILDEAQNATIHELKTVITRVGENSKIILLGDIDQIDTPYIDSLSNGLTIVAEKFKNEKIAGHVELQRGERSTLSYLASKII